MSVTEQAVPGTVIPSGSLVSPGGGQGPQGITAVSADTGNLAILGSDNLVSVPQSQIWSVRLRSFNAIGNPTFEVDQRNGFGLVSNAPTGAFLQDRWIIGRGGTMAVNWQAASAGVNIPGTSFMIATRPQRCTLTTQQTTLGATDTYGITQNIEGPQWRELSQDVTSISLLVRTSVANLKFSVALRDSAQAYSLVKLCTIPSANTWTLIALPNVPLPSSGTLNYAPGQNAYILNIMLSAGSTWIAPAADTWQTGNFVGAPGMNNFCGQVNGSTFDIGYVSHEPGAQCSNPPIDCSWTQNYDDALRYFQKTYSYATVPGTATSAGVLGPVVLAAGTTGYGPISFKKTMAKVPTVTIYNWGTGAANSLMDSNGTSHASAAASNISDAGFSGVTFSTATAGACAAYTHYTADTGW